MKVHASNSNKIEFKTETDNKSNRFDKYIKSFKKNLGENLLLLGTILAVVFGVALGFILRATCDEFNKNEIAYFNFVGELFLRMLKFLILPLIGSSLISGIAGLGSGNGGKIALRALTYYFLSTFFAVVIGIVLVISIQPGKGKNNSGGGINPVPIDVNKKVTTHDTILDLVRFVH
jgi:Na+/H+-dicarboxylate symporter